MILRRALTGVPSSSANEGSPYSYSVSCWLIEPGNGDPENVRRVPW